MICNALIIPDQHMPYHHPDSFNFLRAIKQKFGPFDLITHLGDETDGCAWSYHETNPGLANPDLEFDRAKRAMQELFDFADGKIQFCKSNHGSLAYRKARTGKIPNQIMAGAYERALEAPPQCKWFDRINLHTPRGKVELFHGYSTINTWLVAKERGHSIITGHFHTKQKVTMEYVESNGEMIFAAQVGTLIDRKSPAFEYNALTKEKVKLGCLVLHEGFPLLIPMKVNALDRWTGEL